jgi:phage terminase small subunit
MPHRPPKAENAAILAVELTLRERRFVEEYVVDLNGRNAAVRAGLGKTVKSATELASRMRKKATVAAAINALMGERGGTTSTAIVNELGAIAFSKITDYLKIEKGRLVLAVASLDQLPDEAKAAISRLKERVNDDGSISIEVELHDKIAALTQLGKSLGMFKERAEVDHNHTHMLDVDPLIAINERLDRLAAAQRLNTLPEIDAPVQRALPRADKPLGPIIEHD